MVKVVPFWKVVLFSTGRGFQAGAGHMAIHSHNLTVELFLQLLNSFASLNVVGLHTVTYLMFQKQSPFSVCSGMVSDFFPLVV